MGAGLSCGTAVFHLFSQNLGHDLALESPVGYLCLSVGYTGVSGLFQKAWFIGILYSYYCIYCILCALAFRFYFKSVVILFYIFFYVVPILFYLLTYSLLFLLFYSNLLSFRFFVLPGICFMMVALVSILYVALMVFFTSMSFSAICAPAYAG